MQLKSFRVQMFRNVIDSGDIPVGPNTCLVGKNEAGKSSIIEALHRLNPAKPLTSFSLLDDYPRWLKKRHELTKEIDTAVPITATYALSDAEVLALEERFGLGVLASSDIIASRRYTGDMLLGISVDAERFMHQFIEDYDLDDLRDSLRDATPDEIPGRLEAISNAVDENSQPTAAAAAAKKARAAYKELLAGSKSLSDALDAAIRTLIPKTFYFSSYAQLAGRYNLTTEVLPAVKSGSPDDKVQTAAEFLKLAHIDPASVQTWEFEQWNAELEAVSSMLTTLVKENWRQNEHLRLRVNVEPQPAPNGQVERYLQFRVEDTRHDFTSRLDRRSTGFQWFVSFMAAFFEFQADKTIVLLLDEPGLSLHARAQKDLLDCIDNTLTKGRQIIYTTHSPFMVRTEALNQVRIVEDRGPAEGVKVTSNAGVVSDPDTLFPLQAALGYDLAQNLFIGKRNILVEGVSDFVYLTAISSHLASLGRRSLPSDARLLPAGGATNIPTFIALLGTKLDVVVLLDGNAQRQKIESAIVDGRLASSRVFSLEQFCDVKGADIEDLFSEDEYLALYNATLSKTVTPQSIPGTDRIVKRIARSEGDFDHGRVAAYFLSHQHEIVPSLSAQTVDRFERVIGALVGALPS